jgi:hypothetical protein
MHVRELNPEEMGSLWPKVSTMLGEWFCLRAIFIGGDGLYPFLNYTLAFALQLRKRTKLGFIMYDHSIRISKKAQPITITAIKWLMLIPVCPEGHMKPVNTICEQSAELLFVKSGRA